MTSYRYAAYGSNLHPERLRKRAPSATLIGTSFLQGYSLRFHKRSDVDGSGKCSILAGGNGVHVAVFDIEKPEKEKLDRIEGVGTGYKNREIQLDGFGPCVTYVAIQACVDDSLVPMDWYKEYVLQGARFNGFPAEYISYVEQIKAVPDFDTARSDREWQSIRRFQKSPRMGNR